MRKNAVIYFFVTRIFHLHSRTLCCITIFMLQVEDKKFCCLRMQTTIQGLLILSALIIYYIKLVFLLILQKYFQAFFEEDKFNKI